jgi:hypothetical protein
MGIIQILLYLDRQWSHQGQQTNPKEHIITLGGPRHIGSVRYEQVLVHILGAE